MVEVVSWFYKIPTFWEFEEYAATVDPGCSLVVKAPQGITLTHKRSGIKPNPEILSLELFSHFLEQLPPIKRLIGYRP